MRPKEKLATGTRALLSLLLLPLTLGAGETHCADRLERALDLLQQRGPGSSTRRRHDLDDPDLVYHQRLSSAPIEVSVTKLLVEIPQASGSGTRRNGLSWAKVERCSYEPSSSSIRTRLGFNELAVTGLLQLVAQEAGDGRALERLLPAESCRMSLRLRHAGMDFYTSPIARGRGQMRIRTESSFLEPRFATIYAYGCRPLGMPHTYDRIGSEPRKRDLRGSESNFVSNSSVLEEEDATENRLSESIASIPVSISQTSNDVLLESLWRSRNDIAREMEDVFLRSASQAITHYIERQLHSAIKETLMLSMGYTISYG